MLIRQLWCVHVLEFMGEYYLWVCPCFFQQCPAYLDRLLLMVCEMGVSGGTAAVLWGATSRICSKWHTAFLCSSHLAFSPSVSLASCWCNHTVLLMHLQVGRIPVLFDRIVLISIKLITGQLQSMPFQRVCWHRFQ